MAKNDANIWNHFVNTVGNLIGTSDSTRRSLMYGDFIDDTDITTMLNKIKSYINEKKNFEQVEIDKIDKALDDLLMISKGYGTPDLNQYISQQVNNTRSNLEEKRKLHEKNLSNYEQRLNNAEGFAQDVYNLDTPIKTRNSKEYKTFEKSYNDITNNHRGLLDTLDQFRKLNTIERSARDAI